MKRLIVKSEFTNYDNFAKVKLECGHDKEIGNGEGYQIGDLRRGQEFDCKECDKMQEVLKKAWPIFKGIT